MRPLWYRNAVIYQINPALFRDANGDGWGDLRGITERLPYLRGLGVTCVWLMPFYPSPHRDGGYDVADYLSVDPRFGNLADMVALLEKADELGIRIIIDLVVQHTSTDHPWFQAARKDRNSPYRKYYIWADEPEPTEAKPIFPTVEDSVWTWDETAGQYYRHVFYSHEPDLDLGVPEVRSEIESIMSFWLRLGVSGFRVDAASHMIERAKLADPRDDGFWLLEELRDHVALRRPDAVLFGEVDVPVQEYSQYFGDGDRLNMVSSFWLNNHLFLALARQQAEPLAWALQRQPAAPRHGQYVLWVRNHDELDLERLTDAEREEVMEQFAPDEDMRIYARGIRRRLPPMLDGDVRRVAMAHAIMLSLPGTPIVRYGEEIGMGDDLSQPERLAVRTSMQWSDEPYGGFSAVPDKKPEVPVIAEGRYGYQEVNVYSQVLREGSLLTRTGRMIRARLGLHEIGTAPCSVLDVDCPSLLALAYKAEKETVLVFANLSSRETHCEVPGYAREDMLEVLTDEDYDDKRPGACRLRLNGYGYRWFRVVPGAGTGDVDEARRAAAAAPQRDTGEI